MAKVTLVSSNNFPTTIAVGNGFIIIPPKGKDVGREESTLGPLPTGINVIRPKEVLQVPQSNSRKPKEK